MPFQLHPQLMRDFHVLGRCGATRSLHLLLRRNAILPWFLLVPESDALELHELEPALREELDRAADCLAVLVKRHFACDKINTAAIGNIVPQLHLHLIGRRRDDCCWPQAPWGHVNVERDYASEELVALQSALLEEARLGFGNGAQ